LKRHPRIPFLTIFIFFSTSRRRPSHFFIVSYVSKTRDQLFFLLLDQPPEYVDQQWITTLSNDTSNSATKKSIPAYGHWALAQHPSASRRLACPDSAANTITNKNIIDSTSHAS